MSIRFFLALPLLLSGCAFGPSDDTPQGQCQRQAENDPAVKEIYRQSAGWYTTGGSEAAEINATVRDAYLRCLRAKGIASPGGVETVRVR